MSLINRTRSAGQEKSQLADIFSAEEQPKYLGLS